MWQAGDKLGRFHLDKEIGQGSHGVVYVATDSALGIQVAVKILHPWLTQDTAVRDRFKRELLLARRIAHPGICRLFDLHEEGEAFFITMDYVEGQTLLNILKNEGRLRPMRGVKILRGVCQALSAAHAAGVIHRDLKPANIIVRAGDSPMILDFGTATAGDVSRVTRPGTAVGSMRFIAPEVFTGVSPSTKTDIYSLGVVAYVALAGKLPYNAAAGAIEMLELIKNQPPMRIDVVQKDVPPALADVIEKAMAKDPEARFTSPLAFDEALAAVERALEASDAAPTTADFARWAPSAVIKSSVGAASGGPTIQTSVTPAPLPPSQAPTNVGVNPMMQAGETAVDLKAPPAGVLTLGTQLPENPSSGAIPLAAGQAVDGITTPAVAAFVEPRTDETPRQVSVPSPSSSSSSSSSSSETVVTAMPEAPTPATDLTLEGASVDEPPDASDEVEEDPLAATIQTSRANLDAGEQAAIRSGVDKRLLAAGAAIVVVIVAVVALKSGGDPAIAAADAGSAAVATALDAGAAASGDAGSPKVVDAKVDARVDAKAEGEGDEAMVFPDPVDPVDPTPSGDPKVRPKADPHVDDGIKQLRATMAKKGLAMSDVPDVENTLIKAHFSGVKGKRADADRLLAQAKASVDAVVVDRAFVNKKLVRFNKAYDRTKRPDLADKIEKLSRDAAGAFAAGDYDTANRKLSTAFSLVSKAK